MQSTVTEFAPAKINLALHVLGRRPDGYHELDSVVAFADVGDVLVFSPALEPTLSVDGAFSAAIPATQDNLVLKAHAALRQLCDIPNVAIQLTKNLPVASGIGGGSADAAAALRGLVRLFALDVGADNLQRIALTLGADVPVCLHGKACRMQGVGEIILPLEKPPAAAIVLVNPLQACATADVFRTMGLNRGDVGGTEIDMDTPATWRNDMAGAAQTVLPVIADVLAALHKVQQTQFARMSGSGATCFALFDHFDQAVAAAEQIRRSHPGWWIAPANLA
jgi:4-diphosphocytidyl-2-C-methyl-D-erythritol kinase